MLCGVRVGQGVGLGTVGDVIKLQEREAGFGPNPETATAQCRNGPMGGAFNAGPGLLCFLI